MHLTTSVVRHFILLETKKNLCILRYSETKISRFFKIEWASKALPTYSKSWKMWVKKFWTENLNLRLVRRNMIAIDLMGISGFHRSDQWGKSITSVLHFNFTSVFQLTLVILPLYFNITPQILPITPILLQILLKHWSRSFLPLYASHCSKWAK